MTTPACRKCGAEMQPGKALVNAPSGIGDFHDRDGVATMSFTGPAYLAKVWKCPACGWSVSK